MARIHVLKYLIPILAATVALISSCDDKRVFEQNIELPNNAWHKDSVLTFKVTILDSQQEYNIYYNIRNSRSYGAQNIFLQIELTDTLGQKLASDLNNIELFDAKTGEPFGKGIDVFDHQVAVFKNYRFPKAGLYELHIQHQMRDEAGGVTIATDGTLQDIIAVGVRVENAKKEDQ